MPRSHGTEAEAEEGARAASAASDDDSDEAQARNQAAAQAEPGEELGAAAAEGRGAKGAVVTADAQAAGRHFDVDADGAGNVSRITFYRDDAPDVVMARPAEDSNDMLLWRLYETTRFQFRRRRTELQSAINRAHSALSAQVTSHHGREHAAMPHLAPEGRYPPPKQIKWKTRPLPERVVEQLQGTYFLKIEEKLSDCNGNLYAPSKRLDANQRWKWRGSMLGGKFPHAVVSMKDPGEGVTSRSDHYICAENNVHLVVKLMKRVEGGEPEHVSESHVLTAVEDAFSPAQRASWGEMEGKMWLYTYLEFDDNEVVGANAFDNPPDFGHLFKPPESQPSYLQNEDPGYYEFKMTGGVGDCVFNFADRVTNKNLKAEHKLKRRKFRLVVKALNYHLVGLEGFTARSTPFLVKGVLHNDVKSNERHVCGPDGMAVDSGPADTPK